MLDLRVYNKKSEDPIVTRLGLVESGDGVVLTVVDNKGKSISGGLLLKITADGCLERFVSVAGKFGFTLDRKGRLHEEDAK